MASIEVTNSQRKFYEVVVKNVSRRIKVETFLSNIRRDYDVHSATRINRACDGKPTESIRIKTSDRETQQNLISNGLKCENGIYSVEMPHKHRIQVLRCFRCQHIGYNGSEHTGRSCSVLKCMKCSGPHDVSDCDCDYICCANCEQPHMANSNQCPVWIETVKSAKRASKLATRQDIDDVIENLNSSHTLLKRSVYTKLEELENDTCEQHEKNELMISELSKTVSDIQQNIHLQNQHIQLLISKLCTETQSVSTTPTSPHRIETLLTSDEQSDDSEPESMDFDDFMHAYSPSTDINTPNISIELPVPDRTPETLTRNAEQEPMDTKHHSPVVDANPESMPRVRSSESNLFEGSDSNEKLEPQVEQPSPRSRCCPLNDPRGPPVFKDLETLPCCMEGAGQLLFNMKRDIDWTVCNQTPVFAKLPIPFMKHIPNHDTVTCCLFHRIQNRIVLRQALQRWRKLNFSEKSAYECDDRFPPGSVERRDRDENELKIFHHYKRMADFLD